MTTVTQQPEFNPYAAPQADGLGTTDYYRLVSTRITYAEYWRMAKNPLQFLILALLKTVRISYPFKTAHSFTRQLSIVGADQIPEHVRALWAEPLAEAERLGYRPLFYTVSPMIGQGKEAMRALLLSPDATTSVSLIYVRVHVLARLIENVVLAATSRLPDDRRASTYNMRLWLKDMPDEVSQCVPRRQTFGKVVEAHLRWLRSRGWEPQPIDVTGLAERLHRRGREEVDFHLRRGVFRQMTEREVEAYARISPHANALALTDADRRFFRMLRFLERFVPIVMVMTVVFSCIRPGRRSLLPLLVIFLCFIAQVVLIAVRSAKNWAVQRRS